MLRCPSANQCANFLENEVKGGVRLLEEKTTANALFDLVCMCDKKMDYFKQSMRVYKDNQKK